VEQSGRGARGGAAAAADDDVFDGDQYADYDGCDDHLGGSFLRGVARPLAPRPFAGDRDFVQRTRRTKQSACHRAKRVAVKAAQATARM
jgi:hypothetical protein